MADFKIKPASVTCNKLILESEDGTDVLTTSDSGVTLASATLTSPTLNSPTLNSPTLVTPELGTPASGALTNCTSIPAAGITGGTLGATFNKSINGTTSDQTFFTNDSIFMGSYLVAASTTQTVTTPSGFEASNCVLMGKTRSVSTGGSTTTQNDTTEHICSFTGTNTISLVNSSGYTAYCYFCCIRFK